MKAAQVCRACKKGRLFVCDRSPTLTILECKKCGQLTTLKTSFGKITEVAVPGMAAVTGTITILGFLEVDNIDDLLGILADIDF